MSRLLSVVFMAVVVAGPHAGTCAAQSGRRERAFRGTSFALATYASGGTMAFYGAYGVGPVTALLGIVRNPRARTRVLMVGGGTRARFGRGGTLTMLAAVAGGSGGPTLRFYTLPAFRFGRWRLYGTAKTYVRLAEGRRWKASLDPLVLSFSVAPDVGAGLATMIRRGWDGTVVMGAGPAAGVRLAGMTVRGEVVWASRTGATEGRLSLGVAF